MELMRTAGVVVATGALAFTLAGCSGAETADDDAAENTATAENSAAESTAAEESAAETQAKYGVTIDSATVTTDYQGAPAMVVTYTFTNNSDEAIMPSVALDVNAYQNGVELDYGVVSDIDSQSTTREIKPGATIACQQAYVLNDQSDVTVEASELISFSDEILATATFPAA